MSSGSPSRLLFAIGGLNRGGSETQLVRLLESMPQPLAGVGLVLSDSTATDYLPQVEALGIRVFAGPAIGHLRRPLRVAIRFMYAAWTVARFRPGVIYAWLDEAALYLAPIGRLARIPVVVARRNVSGSVMERQSRWVRMAQVRAERAATLVTANSEAVARVAELRGVSASRIRIVPNGHPRTAPLPLPKGGNLVIGYVAHYRPGKGHATMIEAASLLPPWLKWRLLMNGRGPLLDEVKALAERRRLGDRVAFEAIDDPRSFWSRCHLAVLLSDSEGSPNALIEAAFAGRPMVATAVGGTPEVVCEGAGKLVAVDDASGAARAIETLLGDPASLSAMGMRAWKHVAARFTIEAMVEGHLRVITEASSVGPSDDLD